MVRNRGTRLTQRRPVGNGGSTGMKVTCTSASPFQHRSSKSACTDCPPTYCREGATIATRNRLEPASRITLWSCEISSATSIIRLLLKLSLRPVVTKRPRQTCPRSYDARARKAASAKLDQSDYAYHSYVRPTSGARPSGRDIRVAACANQAAPQESVPSFRC